MVSAGIMTTQEFNEMTAKREICIVSFTSLSDTNSRLVLPVLEYVSDKHKDLSMINFDTSSAQNIAEKFDINSVPMLIILKKGKEIARLEPKPDVREIEHFISSNIN